MHVESVRCVELELLGTLQQRGAVRWFESGLAKDLLEMLVDLPR